MPHITQETKKEILAELKKLDCGFKFTASIKDSSRLIIKIKGNTEPLKQEEMDYEEFYNYHFETSQMGKKIELTEEKYNFYSKIRDSAHKVRRLKDFPAFYKKSTEELYNKIDKVIKECGKWYDESDAMSDYFNCAFYYDIKLA